MSHAYEEIVGGTVKAIAGFGAFGIALQNYPAVMLFLKDILPAGKSLEALTQSVAVGAGGLCSGFVNLWMNIELLEGFAKRLTGAQSKALQLTYWEWSQYYAGLVVFVVTGMLFGLMAFTFAMEGPLAMLSIVSGILVAIIMTIQEVETWLCSYEQEPESQSNDERTLGQWVGIIIAVGNVLALSLLFTLSLAQSLMMLNLSASLSWMIGASVAFSFGAFTEFFFYNHYLSNFCNHFSEKMMQLTAAPNWGLGFSCVLINAAVNAALTYAGVSLVVQSLLPTGLLIPIFSAVTAFFAGSASWILGLDFCIRQNNSQVIEDDFSSVREFKF